MKIGEPVYMVKYPLSQMLIIRLLLLSMFCLSNLAFAEKSSPCDSLFPNENPRFGKRALCNAVHFAQTSECQNTDSDDGFSQCLAIQKARNVKENTECKTRAWEYCHGALAFKRGDCFEIKLEGPTSSRFHFEEAQAFCKALEWAEKGNDCQKIQYPQILGLNSDQSVLNKSYHSGRREELIGACVGAGGDAFAKWLGKVQPLSKMAAKVVGKHATDAQIKALPHDIKENYPKEFKRQTAENPQSADQRDAHKPGHAFSESKDSPTVASPAKP